MIKNISFFFFLLVNVSLFSQEINLEKYQYIVVADKFDFLKKADQYQTSSLTKFLLKKKGFKVFLSNEKLPKEVVNNRCSVLFAAVNDLSSMFKTKIVIEIKDCYNKVLYTSEEGGSKLKEYKKAYHEAIRNAFETMEDFEYSYNSNLIDVKKEDVKVVIPAKNSPKVIVTQEITSDANAIENKVVEASNLLYAQPKNNGFQLVNLKPEVVFIIFKTNVKDVFVIKDKNGILYKNGNYWIAEYYENDALIAKKFEVKF